MIEDFAQSWHLTTWDWLAFIVAILSFFVAGISLIIATRTLRSQKKTEENTTPIMSKQVQEFLFDGFFIDLFDSYLHLNALSNLLEEVRYGAYPSSDIVVDSVLPIYDIHCELYYDDQDSYQVLQGLWKMAEKYNRRLISYGKDLCNPSISACFLENELSDLLGRNIDIAESWSKVISLLSGHKENRGYYLLSKYILDSAPGDSLSETPQRYDNNDFYVQSYFEGPSQEAFISFMSQYTVGVENTIKDYMMPINRVE